MADQHGAVNRFKALQAKPGWHAGCSTVTRPARLERQGCSETLRRRVGGAGEQKAVRAGWAADGTGGLGGEAVQQQRAAGQSGQAGVVRERKSCTGGLGQLEGGSRVVAAPSSSSVLNVQLTASLATPVGHHLHGPAVDYLRSSDPHGKGPSGPA